MKCPGCGKELYHENSSTPHLHKILWCTTVTCPYFVGITGKAGVTLEFHVSRIYCSDETWKEA